METWTTHFEYQCLSTTLPACDSSFSILAHRAASGCPRARRSGTVAPTYPVPAQTTQSLLVGVSKGTRARFGSKVSDRRKDHELPC